MEAWLDHVSRYNSYIDFGGHFGITRVTVSEPQANYSRLIDGEMEHWFEWVVMIRGEESDFHHTGYYIDAETGEVLMIMGMDTLTLTDEMISNPNDPITMQVGKTFAITLESQPVSLFTYLGYENQVIAVMTPSATLFIKDPGCAGGHLFSIDYGIFRVVAMVANTGNGLLLIHDVFVNGTAIYQNPSFPL